MRTSLACLLLLVSTAVAVAEELPPLEVRIGQMLVVGFRGFEVTPDAPIMEDLQKRHIGGVILFDYDVELGKPERNIRSAEQVRKLVGDLKAASAYPLLVAIDQEGGRVNRLKERFGFPATISAEKLAAQGVQATRRQGEATARTLAGLGINVNFGPVVDLRSNPSNPVIAKLERSFSADPEVVLEHARAWIDAHRRQGVMTTPKHFPGHGSSRDDSHHGFTDVTDSWRERELEPWHRLIAEGRCDAVMTAHIFNSKLDSKRPATLSPAILDGILRGKLGFDGPIFSDDLQMKAISAEFGLEAALEYGIQAGLDFLLFGNNTVYEPDVAARAVAAIRRMVEEGRISEERINQSWRRIQAFKENLGRR